MISVLYIERVHKERGPVDVEEFMSLSNYPLERKKRIDVLKYFRNHMKSKSGCVNLTGIDVENMDTQVYLSKWLGTKYAKFFRLSNQTLQVRPI